MYYIRQIKRATIAIAVLCTGMPMASTAMAQDSCATDADCAEGQACEVVASTGCACAPCVSPEECPPCDCEGPDSEIMGCVTPPVFCESDADCPTYLSCLFMDSSVPCYVDENGNTNCGDPQPTPTTGTCEYQPQDCSSASDCDEGFACEQYATPCAGTCDEAGNCEEWCDPAPAGGNCYPEQIACNADSDCPSDWTCYEFTYSACSGGGGTDCACAPCMEGEECLPCECDEPVDPDPMECTEGTERYCIPAEWEQYVDSYATGGGVDSVDVAAGEESQRNPFDGDDGIFRGDGSSEPTSDGGGSSSSSDGCSIATFGASPSERGLLIGLLIGMAAMVIRRR